VSAVGRDAVLEREQRWRVPVAAATFAAIALVVASMVVIGSVGGDGEAEVLRAVDRHSSDITIAGILRALGMALLVLPLTYLFRAAQARSDRVRGQLIGLIVIAPLFLAGGTLLNSVATTEAADEFVAGKVSADLTANEATSECRGDRRDDAEQFREDFGSGVAALDDCASEKLNDDAATNAFTEASSRGLATGLGLAGSIGLAFGLAYSCLWAMRVGLLTRFWGSLGMALGVAALLQLIQFSMLWFLYFAFLLLGWVPGGRPPAWEEGEAIPWPTPGEKAATELSASTESESEDAPTEKGQSQ
jgi:hypothetical protein